MRGESPTITKRSAFASADELTLRLDQERISQRFLAGPINICTLMPMRSIPAQSGVSAWYE